MMKFFKTASLLGLLALAACSSTPDSAPPAADPAGQDSAGSAQSGLQGSAVEQQAEVRELTPLQQAAARDAALRQQLVLYFDFDSSQISDEHMMMLDAHARYLRDQPAARLRLEGHTDERGTREYNIALGERRAEAVRRALLLRGATRAQLLVVSYGEEKPAVLGTGEGAWSKNRRVVLVYQ